MGRDLAVRVLQLLGPALLLAIGTRAALVELGMSGRARATIVDVREAKGRGKPSHCPVLRWTHDGMEHVHAATLCSHDPSEHAIGSTLPVRYEPDDPAHFVIDSFVGRHLVTVVVGAIALVLSLASVRSWKRERSRRRPDWDGDAS